MDVHVKDLTTDQPPIATHPFQFAALLTQTDPQQIINK